MKIEFKPLVFIDREGKPGGGKGLLISKDLTFTLSGLRQHLLVWEDGHDRGGLVGQDNALGIGGLDAHIEGGGLEGRTDSGNGTP